MDIEPYLDGRSINELSVGDEIVFPEPDPSITAESLVGLRIAVRWKRNAVYEGLIDRYDPNTGKHHVTYDDGDQKEYNLAGDSKRQTFADRFAFEGAETYFCGRGRCTVGMFHLNFDLT